MTSTKSELKIGILGGNGFLGRNIIQYGQSLGIKIENINLKDSSNKQKVDKFQFIINCLMKMPKPDQRYIESSEIRDACFVIPAHTISNLLLEEGCVINTSTYLQHFEGKRNNPLGVYAQAKQELTNYIDREAKKGRFSAVDLVFFTLYGPNDKPNRLIPSIVEAVHTKSVLRMTEGNQLINLLNVLDAAKFIVRSIHTLQKDNYKIYKVFGDNFLSLRQLLEICSEVAGVCINCKWGALPYSGVEMRSPWTFDIPIIPDFTPEVSLTVGLKELFTT